MQTRNDPGNPVLPLLTLAGVYLAWDYTMAGGHQVARVIAWVQWLQTVTTIQPQTMAVAGSGLSALAQVAILMGLFFVGAMVMLAMGAMNRRNGRKLASTHINADERRRKPTQAVQHRRAIGRGKMRKVSL